MNIVRMKKGSWGKIVAFFDLQTSEGLLLKGFKIIEGNNGLFVAYPSQKDAEGNFFDTIHSDKNVRDKVNEIALTEYEKENNNAGLEHVGSSSNDEDVPF